MNRFKQSLVTDSGNHAQCSYYQMNFDKNSKLYNNNLAVYQIIHIPNLPSICTGNCAKADYIHNNHSVEIVIHKPKR